jgi:Pilus formation protein N terminal region
MRTTTVLLSAFTTLISFVAANAAFAQAMTIEVDQSKPVRFTTPITGVVVGNAGIADVIVHDSRTLFVIGKSVGSTHVLAVDERGRSVFSGTIAVRAADLQGLLTVQRGKEFSTSICDTRCITYAHSEASNAPLADAVSRASTRTGFASGGGPK